MKHRVLHAIAPSHMSGAEMFLARLVPRLEARGHYAPILCNSRSRAASVLGDYLEKYGGRRPLLSPVGGKLNPRALLHLWHAVRREKCAFTHSHLSSTSWWCGRLDKRGIPSIGHVHGFTSARWHRNQRLLISCSQAVKDDLVRQGIAASRIHVLPNPVDPDDIMPRRTSESVRAEFGAGEDTPIIGSFGHLRSDKKGWPEYFEAVEMVVRRMPRAHFWICGQGPLQAEYEKLVAGRGLTANVRFLGFRTDAADIMNAIDVMALPSRREPFGLVYVEAALLNKPSIACAAGGAPEVVVPGETGWLVPPEAPEKIADAMIDALADRHQARQMGEAAREKALAEFSWSRALETIEEIYDRIETAKER